MEYVIYLYSAYQTRCGVGDLRVVHFASDQQNMMDSARSAHQQRTPALHAVLLKGASDHHRHHLWRYTHTTHAILTAILNTTDLSSLHIRSHDAVLQQPTDERRYARRNGYGHGCESRYDGSESDAAHAGDGQLWSGMEKPCKLISGQCEGGADGSSRVMIIPCQVLLTSPKPPGEPGILYVSRFISKSRSTTHTTPQANAQYNGGRLERSFFDNIVRLCREYESNPTAITHKTNVHSSDPTAQSDRFQL